jgi:hypothetical protein
MAEQTCIKINRRDGERFTWEILNSETHEIQGEGVKSYLTLSTIDKGGEDTPISDHKPG